MNATAVVARIRDLQGEWKLVTSALDEPMLRAPSTLPGWSRAHLLTHLARNADAVINLLTWAESGVEHPMYGPGPARDDDIEAGSLRSAEAIHADVVSSGERLVDFASTLPERTWTAPVRARLGQPITGADALTLRLAELTIHLVDLDRGHDFARATALLGPYLGDVVENMIGMYPGALPSCRLSTTDGTHTWTLGDGSGGSGGTVTGRPGDLLAWVSGRADGSALGGSVPELGSLV
ncbi:maleylpyruvate isomerase family mycothiol-dependent enzyme [Amycolatopsis sp. PS_44_ISF1]|uniref:maleylpyruvate isomerase family mycothiol-dependent enzyme n=1 Tax=Amycolatopsis sp. PS_44_ISF1 TaxID=2974917 RepID=UPI0028DFD7DA|nr:maleylpyruvate isomerase family mycothiol-dependent enzyme [Amycolatopsis sp. PS_44_ISF1]MDT8909652.1 maleylpyruvate isomerase family mycothiol-dependent enzyme [Amycolatopsis sp. PS_44_ISF1]